jgi:hypothetical protein
MSAFKVTDLFLGEKNFIDFVEKNLGQERERLKEDELETDIGKIRRYLRRDLLLLVKGIYLVCLGNSLQSIGRRDTGLSIHDIS